MFMDVYAAFCRHHMATFGTTQRQIASIAAKNHTHSVHNPLSQYQVPYTTDEILAAPPITYPLTRFHRLAWAAADVSESNHARMSK